ncbi:MAG: acylphosphatase [Desulfobulbaceae bacterium]|nr:acylphosphatase [Desulfobulbaceae bacterium]
MSSKRIHAIVYGRVQGVFFRDYTQREAVKLGLNGWVRNLPDGTVETVFEGNAGQVDRMLFWLSTGSPMSRVSVVNSRKEDITGERDGFMIRD